MSIPAHRPHHVYRHYDEAGALLYVGVTSSPTKRPFLRSGRPWVTDQTRIEVGPPQTMWLAYKEEWGALRDAPGRYNMDRKNGWIGWVAELQDQVIAQWSEDEQNQSVNCMWSRLREHGETPNGWYLLEDHVECVSQRLVVQASYFSGDFITREMAEEGARKLMARRTEQAAA